MFVTKASGKRERFQRKKIIKTCLRAGASEDLAERIANEIEKRAYNGISTKEILRMILELLDKYSPKIAAKYDLKGAVMRLGPAGYSFEHMISELFSEYGYETEWHRIVRGFCVDHEVDVIAKKGGKKVMIECKYHNSPGVYTGLKAVLYTHARFLDLNDGGAGFSEVWLVSNTKFSSEAVKYASCRRIKVIGWNHPRGGSLKELLEKKRLYPITVLRSLDRRSQELLSAAGLMFCRDLLKKSVGELVRETGIPRKKAEELRKEAGTVVE